MRTKTEDIEMAREQQRIINAYKECFGTPAGQIVLEHLKKVFRYGEMAFSIIGAVKAYCPITAALTDGGRAVVIHILKILAAPNMGDADIKEPKVKVTR